jgi:uncharacterized protein YkwD
MLRALALSFAMVAVPLAFSVAQAPPPAAATSIAEDAAAENELLAAANNSRQLAGAPPLRADERLREAAKAHARLMVATDRLEHQLPGELSLLQRIAQTGGAKGALNVDRVGENIAFASGASSANDALMHSPPHRRNLLDSGFNVAGIAAIWSKGRLYVAQDFAHEVHSYSAQESGQVVGRAVKEMRAQAGMPELKQVRPPNLDEAACSLAKENQPNAHLLATAYDNRRIITYTQSRPEVVPEAAMRLLRDPAVRQFAVGSCYARNAQYPTGTYWVAILLY